MKTRRNRRTKTRITVARADELSLAPEDDCPWFTVCEDHGRLVAHPTRRLAESHAAEPDWCDECQAIMERHEEITRLIRSTCRSFKKEDGLV